jgi:hypothetical protein
VYPLFGEERLREKMLRLVEHGGRLRASRLPCVRGLII